VPASLARLLRLRLLLEESSRMEVERRTAFAARIESARWLEREGARNNRARAQRIICEAVADAEQAARERTLEWSNVEAALSRERQLQPVAQAAAQRLVEERNEFLKRRRERWQVESVLDAEKMRARFEQERRTQRDLDDWFSAKQIKVRRESKSRRNQF
jgi:hypothetical protein